MVDGGSTAEFVLDAGGEPLTWTLRGPSRHRWNGAVVTIVEFRPSLVAKYAMTTPIPFVGDLVDSLVRKTAEEILDVVTWHGRVSISLGRRSPVVPDETRLNPKVQRLTVPVDTALSTLLMFDGDVTPEG